MALNFATFLRKLVRQRQCRSPDRRRRDPCSRRRVGPAARRQADRQGGRTRVAGQPRVEIRRALHGRPAPRHEGHALRRHRIRGAEASPTCRALHWVQAIDKMRIALRGVHQRNDRRRARANIAHHYDLDGNFYRLFLDSGPAIFLRLFRARGRDARGGATRQEAAHRRQDAASRPGRRCSTSAAGSAAWRSIWRASRARRRRA